MIGQSNLILIGGTNRNVGKTTLSLFLINKFKEINPVIGLKVTSIYPNDEKYHGKHETTLDEDFEIIEEKDLSGQKDTSKMLLAGAEMVFYIRTKDEKIDKAYAEFLKLIPNNSIIVCESISLRKFLKPGLFVLIKSLLSQKIKQSAIELEPFADLIINSDGEAFDFDLDKIEFVEGRWRIINA